MGQLELTTASESDHALEEKGIVSSVLTTLAADDPENPRNWSTARKTTTTTVLSLWVLTLTYSSTAYVTSLPALVERYHMSQEVGILGVTLTVFGFAAGPLIFGPASELYGRQIVYRLSGICYTAFGFGAAFAPNVASLLIFRFFVGFFGSPSLNNVPASIGDYTTLRERILYLILYAICAFGGPALGPLVSAFVEHDAGFRWNLRVMAIFCGVLSILVAFVPETHGPTLLRWRIKKSGRAPPTTTFSKVISVFKTALSRPIMYLFTEPLVTFVSLYLSVLYGILYGFFEMFTVVFLEIRGFQTTSYGLTWIALGLGFAVAGLLMATVGQTMYKRSADADAARGVPTRPEARLGLSYLGSILIPISLFMFAWTAPFPSIHWIAPCIAEFLFACGTQLIFTTFIPYLIDVYQTTAASALAAGMASRSVVASVFPLFSIQMAHALTVQGSTSLLAGIACLLAPLPFVFKWYGSRMRERSKYTGF
ncbi:major facilitator superfamily domain-containing protein [Mycena alexandri]|uniref:Major facilitator superfamily domain-containing protein n=1 Tax=Mycena alexandri TaxID=1745969 RepID=A0AAD6S6Q6_9AGAR|nr:major facilitator superfamily domain-containing protein [Mycena alexandri]